MGIDDLGSQAGHHRAVPARKKSAQSSQLLEFGSNRIMIAFMIGSALLLAMVSLWVFARFSPQTLTLGIRSQQEITAVPSGSLNAPPAPTTTTPAPLPIAIPPSVPPKFWTPSVPASTPSPSRTTAPATSIVDLPLLATNPSSTAVASPTVTTAAPTVPAAPTNVTAAAGDAAVTVSWTAPTNGGRAITSYTVTPYIGATPQSPTVITGVPLATSATLSGLGNGTTYTFTVAATNSIGTGPESAASSAVTPATVPGAPTNVTGTAGDRSVTIDWTAPADGGSTITSYTITPYIGTTAQTPTVITGGPPATSATVTGLENGTTYTFIITAANAIGTGPPSTESNPATPAPPAPSPGSEIVGDEVNWNSYRLMWW